MTPEALTYLNYALDYIQAHSVRREQIEWAALRQEALALVEAAQSPAKTYPAIHRALALLRDQHSRFLEPEKVRLLREGRMRQIGLLAVYPSGYIGKIYPGSPAEQAGLRVGDRLERINDHPVSTLTLEQFREALRASQMDMTYIPVLEGDRRSVCLEATSFVADTQPQGMRLADDIGFLEVPDLLGNPDYFKPYATRMQQVISEIDQTPTAGWILDLRTNIGGALWPMIAGLGPILGEGENMAFVGPHEKLVGTYRGGRAWIEQPDTFSEVDDAYVLKRPGPPVAILTSQLTASSGELVELAFRGSQRDRSFGEPTWGVPTGNDDTELSDGAVIFLTTHLGADRVGQTYSGPLFPDEPITSEWTQLGTADDPVLQAAIRWLRRQTDAL